MQRLFFCLFLLTPALQAQTAIVARLTSDLLPLASTFPSSEPLRDDVYTPAELKSLVTYSQHKVVESWQRDLMMFQLRHNRQAKRPEDASLSFQAFFSPDQSYKLASALSGKDLSENNLTPLVEAIVGIMESAIECRNTSSPLQDSAALHSGTEKASAALRALGVNDRDTQAVTDALLRGAVAASTPPGRVAYK